MKSTSSVTDRTYRVAVVSPQPIVRLGIASLIEEKVLDAGVVSSCDDLTQVLFKPANDPNCILFDTCGRLAASWILELQSLLKEHPDLDVILVCEREGNSNLLHALELGARAVVDKNADPEHLILALETVRSGNYWISGQGSFRNLMAVVTLLRKDVPENSKFGLTRRELMVIAMLAEGLNNRQIADDFNISEETVKRHLSNIFDKIGVSSRLELAMFAIAHELIKVPTSKPFAKAA